MIICSVHSMENKWVFLGYNRQFKTTTKKDGVKKTSMHLFRNNFAKAWLMARRGHVTIKRITLPYEFRYGKGIRGNVFSRFKTKLQPI